MRTKRKRQPKHPLAGTFVQGYFDLPGGRAMFDVALVERVVKARGTNAQTVIARRFNVNLWRLAEDERLSRWDRSVRTHTGQRIRIPIERVRTVCPGDGEGWVSMADFAEWATATA